MVQHHQTIFLNVILRKHLCHILTLKVHHDELVEASELWHLVDQELAIALDLSARITLERHVAQILEASQAFELAPTDEQVVVEL